MHSLISGRLQREPCLNAQFNTWGFIWGFIPAGKKETDFPGLKRSTKGTLVTPREQTGHCKQGPAIQNTHVGLCSPTAASALHCRQQSKPLEPWKMGKTERMKEGNWRGLDTKWSAVKQLCCSNGQQRNGGTPHLSRSFGLKPSAASAKHDPAATLQSWVQGTHRITKCSCIQAWSTGSIHWPQSSEGFWSPPLTKISNYLHILLPFSTFQLHSNANNSSAKRSLGAGNFADAEPRLVWHIWEYFNSYSSYTPELTPPHF